MNDPFDSNDEALARLIREAGDPSFAPDVQYAQALRATILRRAAPARRLVKLAAAAAILVAAGGLVAFVVLGGGSSNLAFAAVSKALDEVRSATFDLAVVATTENGKLSSKATGKGFFLAPSHNRMEISVDIAANPAVEAASKAAARAAQRSNARDSKAAKAAGEAAGKAMAEAVALVPQMKMHQVTIADTRAAKFIMLMPTMKIAMVMDMKKMYEDLKKSAGGPPPDLFEMARRIVREGSSGGGEKAQPLGSKKIDGQEAVGFSVRNALNGMGDMTLWANPRTARPIRIELVGELGANIHMVMSNFRYDVDLDRSLFSLEPPAGYMTQTVDVTMPVEADLLRTLRTVAEHNKGLFPAKLSMNEEVMNTVMLDGKFVMPKMDKATQDKLEAESNKIMAKYGGKAKLRAKYGSQPPPEIMAELMKAAMPIIQEQTDKQMRGDIPRITSRLQGIQFYTSLKPENDAHYAGKGVKLGTPDRPIVWYKPSGAEKYRVIYADLSVKELAPAEVKRFPAAWSK